MGFLEALGGLVASLMVMGAIFILIGVLVGPTQSEQDYIDDEEDSMWL